VCSQRNSIWSGLLCVTRTNPIGGFKDGSSAPNEQPTTANWTSLHCDPAPLTSHASVSILSCRGESHVGRYGILPRTPENQDSSMFVRSARLTLCFGLAARFCLGSGRTRSGGGVPTRVRALAFTALTFENVCFFALLITSLPALVNPMVIMHYSCPEGVASCRIAKGREREIRRRPAR
jgi:hypothetical protein